MTLFLPLICAAAAVAGWLVRCAYYSTTCKTETYLIAAFAAFIGFLFGFLAFAMNLAWFSLGMCCLSLVFMPFWMEVATDTDFSGIGRF
jgi:hypothetical protein